MGLNFELNFFLKIHFYIGILKDSYIKFIFHLKIELVKWGEKSKIFHLKIHLEEVFFHLHQEVVVDLIIIKKSLISW